MYRAVTRAFALTWLAACDADRPLTPDVSKPLLAAGSVDASFNNLTSTAVWKSQIDLSWQDEETNETGWEVHRSTSGPADTFTVLATAGPNVTSYSDTGLTPLTQYCYRVRSFRTTGKKTSYAQFSNTRCSTTPGPPVAPSKADGKPANSSAVDVTWADNSGTENGFRVERSAASTGPWEPAAMTVANATSHQDAGRAGEQQVCYRVVAFNAHGDSRPSNADCTAPPAGPLSLAATAVNPRAIDLTWTDNSLIEDGYNVERAPTEGGPYGVVVTLPANSASYRDEYVGPSTTYWYRVRATKDGGFSDFSNSASATTPTWPGCTETETVCDNYADDDCDGLQDGADPDCPAPACDWGCPPGMVCLENGYCYYPWWESDASADVAISDVCQDSGGGA